jgi:hypothetical protein
MIRYWGGRLSEMKGLGCKCVREGIPSPFIHPGGGGAELSRYI